MKRNPTHQRVHSVTSHRRQVAEHLIHLEVEVIILRGPITLVVAEVMAEALKEDEVLDEVAEEVTANLRLLIDTIAHKNGRKCHQTIKPEYVNYVQLETNVEAYKSLIHEIPDRKRMMSPPSLTVRHHQRSLPPTVVLALLQ